MVTVGGGGLDDEGMSSALALFLEAICESLQNNIDCLVKKGSLSESSQKTLYPLGAYRSR